MNNPVEQLLQNTGLNNSYFAPTSRYFGLETKIMETADFRKVSYVSRRFISQPENYELLQQHRVVQHDRLDNIAQQYYSDPEQFWRICDANAVMHPNELTEKLGEYIKITMPEGISGSK